MTTMKLEGVCKRYQNSKDFAVHDINLTIKDKEFIVFVGPSGCGKSTTLRMIAGLEDITDGEFYINDKLMNDVAPKDRDIAMVFQNYALYPYMTVFDNMAFGLKLRKYKKDEIKKRVEQAAEILDLTDLLDRKPSDMSGGQRQRVAMGRAIVRDAKVFLMDEPLSNLDAQLRVSTRTEIAKIHRRVGAITIYVTHDQTEAMTLADRIVIMNKGAIQQVDAPQDIYDHPVNKFVASFIGSPSMNFFEVKFDGASVTDDKDLTLALPADVAAQLTEHGYKGKKVTMGLRSEGISLAKAETDIEVSKTQVKAEVVVSELLGDETMLYSQVSGTEFVARVDAADYRKPGEKVVFDFNLGKVHFFDIDTEMSIV
jgi:multiple sugar transport system ATP-binding protein